MLQYITSMDVVLAIAFTVANVGGTIFGIIKWVIRELKERDARIAREIKDLNEHTAIQLGQKELKADAMERELVAFKLEVSRGYVTIPALDQVEKRLTSELHRLQDEVKNSGAEIGRRLDVFSATVIEAVASTKRAP